ncbi:hypothetical protein, partial [Salmonella sp. s51228]|uniref:hypothetical protein n=1 Tax=Salmonella sp. s51228 TaxID=3159652 RepID=UPI00397F6C3A
LDIHASGRTAENNLTGGAQGTNEDLTPRDEDKNENLVPKYEDIFNPKDYPADDTNTSARSSKKTEGKKPNARQLSNDRELQPINPANKTLIN